ncbi:hypothetical protein J6590_092508 [Homalodisca vitripennis]|nr:hypothetical protein J6590_092508 [Homalodisca vitripennis]
MLQKISIVSPAKFEIRAVIRYLVLKGKAQWCHEFKTGRTYVHDDQRSGRPSIVTDELEEIIEKAVRDDRRLALDELSAMFPQISRSLIHEKITETLGYRKLPLKEQHKLNRVQNSKEFSERYELEDDNFLYSIVTGDELGLPTTRLKIRGSREIRSRFFARDATASRVFNTLTSDWSRFEGEDSSYAAVL